jgi:uncharacterized protein (TIGR03435 family)
MHPNDVEGQARHPASYDVHVSPSSTSGTTGSEGPDYFGFDLKTVVAKVYGKDPSRIVLPASLDNEERYDFVLVPPREMERAEMSRLMQQGIEKHFGVSVTVEDRVMDVYVMTTLADKTPAAKTGEVNLGFSICRSGPEYAEVRTRDGTPPTAEMLCEAASGLNLSSSGIVDISADNCTMDDFRLALEEGLNRPILDDTNMEGTYDIAVRGARSTEAFVQMLRDQAGIVLTPARRNIEMLVVRSLS